MNKFWIGVCAFTFALGGIGGKAEARSMTYEINGRNYTYETTDPQAVAAARKLIEAANAADAAKATAEAELASNPLVKILESQTQKDAAAATERLEQAMAEHENVLAAQRERPPLRGSGKPSKTVPPQKRAIVAPKEGVSAKTVSQAVQPAVKNVVTDAASGIRTMFMTDGTVREEPIDPIDSTGSVVRPR